MGLYKDFLSRFSLVFDEKMYGFCTPRETGHKGLFDFSVKCRSDNLHDFLHRHPRRRLGLEGMLTVQGSSRPFLRACGILGSLVLFDGMKLRYEFDYIDPFTGRHMVYHGHKHIRLLHPVKSMTTLYGKTYEVRENYSVETADVLSEFRMSELCQFLRSWSFRQ